MNEKRNGNGAPKKKHLGLAVAAAASALLLAGLFAFFRLPAFHALLHPHPADSDAAATRAAAKYTCGMHPFILSDKPGKCPICGMDLTRVEDAGGAPSAGASSSSAPAAHGPVPTGAGKGERKILFYRNPMDPSITSPAPAKDSMGMDYVPVYENEAGGGAAADSLPEGYAAVQVGAERVQLAGIRSAVAVRETVRHPVRAVGVVVPDERRVRRVQAKIEGWIEKLHTNFTGQYVEKGQPLLEIYSPDLVASQREYLLARAGENRMKESPYEDAREMASALTQAARSRLKLFDVPERFIEELEKTGEVQRAVPLNAPVSGYVTGKDVYEGTRVAPGMDLLTVTDLSRVWIEADLYEYEAQSVRVGQAATLETATDPGTKRKGRVAFILPTVSPETRTLKVRFDFPNPGLRLKPQMFVDVSLDLQGATGVVVPDSALIETGTRRIAFVDMGDGRFEPREVKVGVRGGGKAQILSGVKEGEKVAVHANFLLDSESKLRAALNRMVGDPAPSPRSQPSPPPQGQGQGSPADPGGGR